MASPSSQRLWVGMLVVMVVELSGTPQKCIFDEVQAQTRVVRAAPRLRATRSHPGWRPSPPPGAWGRSLRKRSPPKHSSPRPIRIRTWFPVESDGLSEAEKERLEAAVQEAVRMLSSLLAVNRVSGPLLLSRDVKKYCKFLWRNSSAANYNRCGRANNNYRTETCLDVTIPDDHLAGCDIYTEADSPRRTQLRPDGAGFPDTDFLLYLHLKATDKCRAQPRVLAYAAHCQTDRHGRPLAGVVVMCRDRLTAATYDHHTAVQTVIHELFHVLGFSKELFHTWRDCSSTSQVATGCPPRGKLSHSDGSGHVRIYSPSVISALQTHLASSDPELGAPLENLGVSPGKVSSHWESRVLQGSIMAAVLGDWTTIRIDPVTLAALQDTGWYSVNLSRAQSLVWGDGEGAAFGSLTTCQNKSSPFFCTGSGFGCHYLHLHKGQCQTDAYLDGCRVYKPLRNASECWEEKNSRREDWTGEIFSYHSRCFFSNLTRQNQSEPLSFFSSSVEGRCYSHRCTGPNSYQIQVLGSEWVDCPAGSSIQITGYQGLVHCPERRLCFYADVNPPSDDVTALNTRTQSPRRRAAELPAATAFSFTAAVCFLAVASYRKCRCCKVRIHLALEGHTDLQHQ